MGARGRGRFQSVRGCIRPLGRLLVEDHRLSAGELGEALGWDAPAVDAFVTGAKDVDAEQTAVLASRYRCSPQFLRHRQASYNRLG